MRLDGLGATPTMRPACRCEEPKATKQSQRDVEEEPVAEFATRPTAARNDKSALSLREAARRDEARPSTDQESKTGGMDVS